MRPILVCSILALVPLSAFSQTITPYQPLTGAERWNRYWNDTILSPGLYFAAAGAASGGQLGNDPPDWGQGTKGYAKRTAALLGRFTMQTTVHQAASAALGYDPRYLSCDCKGFLRRSGHAIKWTLLTRNNDGETRLDFPKMAGAYGSGMLSMYWYPSRFNPLTDGVRAGNQQMGFEFGVSVIREFSPELKHFFTLGRK